MKKALFFLYTGLLFAQYQQFKPFNSRPYLTVTTSPTHSVHINWNTESPISSIIAYGLTPLLKDTIKISGRRNFHHVELIELFPATTYFYKVIPYGVINTFTTFPEKTDSFSFIVFGDTRSDSAAHQSVINRMAAHEFEFILHSGDLIHHGDRSDEWRTFFNIEDTLLQSKHFMPTIGNHEKPFWQYDTLFALPEPEDYYSFNYGNAHFIMLNTEIDMSGVQRDWLLNDLTIARDDTSIDWIFVTLHRPPFTSGRYNPNTGVQRHWCPLFEEYSVDIVFAGHDHMYERTSKINGVTYIVSAGGGAPLYDVGRNTWTMYSEKTYHFCLVHIKGKRLLLKAIKPNGVVFDSLVLNKTANAR